MRRPSWTKTPLRYWIRPVGEIIFVIGIIYAVGVAQSAAGSAARDGRAGKLLAQQSKVVAQQSKNLSQRVVADERNFVSGQAKTDYKSCIRVNRVVDGVYSLADSRAPARKSAELVLRSPAATDVQRASATATIQNLDKLSVIFHAQFTTERCIRPPKGAP